MKNKIDNYKNVIEFFDVLNELILYSNEIPGISVVCDRGTCGKLLKMFMVNGYHINHIDMNCDKEQAYLLDLFDNGIDICPINHDELLEPNDYIFVQSTLPFSGDYMVIGDDCEDCEHIDHCDSLDIYYFSFEPKKYTYTGKLGNDQVFGEITVSSSVKDFVELIKTTFEDYFS